MKFNLIFEEYLNKILQLNSFKYKFILNTDDNILQCKFESIDKQNNELIFITATINKNDITFQVFSKDKEKIKTYTDKEFLMAYYKEYQNFKNAFKIYKKDPDFFKKQQKDEQPEQDKKIKIDTLDEVMQEQENKSNGYSIKFAGKYYTFTNENTEKISNIITCKFELNNDSSLKADNDLSTYNVIATIKINDLNSKIIKFEFFNPEDTDQATKPLFVCQQSKFKQQFKSEYYNLQAVLSLYQNHYKKQNTKGIF